MEVFDRTIALQQSNGDVELVKERCEAFSKSADATLASLERALRTRTPSRSPAWRASSKPVPPMSAQPGWKI